MREQREIIYAERYDVITAERDLEPEIKAMIKRTINRTVDGHNRNDQEEALKGILNFARQALVPENAISLEDLREVGEVTKRSVNYDAIKVYLNELAMMFMIVKSRNCVQRKLSVNSKSLDFDGC